jgi:hypothetical protein
MNDFDNHGSGLHRLIYVSRAASPEAMDGEIGEIVAKAAAKNRALAVTGVLLAYDGWFVQALEGSYGTLKPLFDRSAPHRRGAEDGGAGAEPPVQPLGHETGSRAHRRGRVRHRRVHGQRPVEPTEARRPDHRPPRRLTGRRGRRRFDRRRRSFPLPVNPSLVIQSL